MEDCFSRTNWNALREASAFARLGYRHPVAVKNQIAVLRTIFEGDVLEPYIATPPGSPPMVLIKGPLFRPSDLHNRPPIEFVVTLPQAFPNAYPVFTIEQPPQPWYIKRHRNVNFEGCCFLQSVSSWTPANGSIAECAKELYRVFEADFPFESNAGGARPPQQHQPPPQQYVGGNAVPRPQQPSSPNAPVVSVQTTSTGVAIGHILANARSTFQQPPPQQQQQQQRPIPVGQPVQQQQAAPYRPPQSSPPEFNFGAHDFSGMLRGAQKPPGTVIQTPNGFGLGAIIAQPANRPMVLHGNVPPPLPPVTDPTPDEQFQRAAQQAKQSQTSGTGFSGAFKSIQNMASDTKFLMEEKVRDSVRQSDVAMFNRLLPHLASETFVTRYGCSTLSGDGTVRIGRVFLTTVGIHFTDKPTDPPQAGVPQRPVFAFSVALSFVASIVLGKEGDRSWLHIVCSDRTFRSFFDITSGVTSKVGELGVSSSLQGTPYLRFYNWLDHAWRRATAVGYHPPASAPPPQAVLSPPTANADQPFAPSSDDNCCICMDRAKNCFLRPCGHLCMCTVCASACSHCPICRAQIDDRLQAFL